MKGERGEGQTTYVPSGQWRIITEAVEAADFGPKSLIETLERRDITKHS